MANVEEKSEIALALEERSKNRKTVVIDGMAFTGPGGRIVGSLAMWVATKREENAAIAQAAQYIKDLGASAQVELKDHELLRDAKTVFILHAVCRDAKAPKSLAAFPTPRWMMEHLTCDEIAKLLNHYLRFAQSQSPFDFDLSPEAVEEESARLAQVSGTELADAIVQSKDRVWLEQFAIRQAMQMASLREHVALLEAMGVGDAGDS